MGLSDRVPQWPGRYVPYTVTRVGSQLQVVITGAVDQGDWVSGILDRHPDVTEVLLDVTHASGAYSSLIAACIIMGRRMRGPIRLRGAQDRLLASFGLMGLRNLVRCERRDGNDQLRHPGVSPSQLALALVDVA